MLDKEKITKGVSMSAFREDMTFVQVKDFREWEKLRDEPLDWGGFTYEKHLKRTGGILW